MKKFLVLSFFFFFFFGYCFSQTVNSVTIVIEITNVVIKGGKVYLSIFTNAESFKNEVPDFTYTLEDNNTILSQELSLPAGEYLITAWQDANGNVKMDYGLFGVPKELVGLSNYFGKGYPSKSFDKQKVLINNTTGKIVIGLYKF
jgi:uncharacterized protein (DUF2141 family)